MKKSNRVSWAPGVDICQVKLFLSEDSPIRVGVKTQDHLQAKTSWKLHSNGVDSDGHSTEFEGHHASALKDKLAYIPQIKWKCPPKFVLDFNWLVAAGEESQEAEAQKHREMRVLEAVYPYFSAIPPSPTVSLDVEECRQHDDSQIPLVPIIPIEEGSTADMLSDMVEPLNASLNSQPLALAQDVSVFGNPNTSHCNPPPLKSTVNEKPALKTLPGLEADVVAAAAAAAAALTAIVKSKEQGSLIDTDLLIKFLSDPKMIEKLSNEHKAPANTVNAPISKLTPVIPSVPFHSSKPDVTKKFANKCEAPANLGIASTTQTKPVTPFVPFLSSKPSVLINEYRGPENTRNEPMSRSMHSTQYCPKPDMGVIPIPKLNPVQPGLPVKPCRMDVVPTSSFSAPVKDVNYYKSLVKLHGEKSETQYYNIVSQIGKRYNDLGDTKLVPIESKLKNQKPCIYFNSAKGCRNGSLCPYQHDSPSKSLRLNAKRMKLSGEITGRT